MTLPPEKIKCHKTGMTKECRKLVTGGHCNRWSHVEGRDARTGAHMDIWGCNDDLQIIMLHQIWASTFDAGAETSALRATIEAARKARASQPVYVPPQVEDGTPKVLTDAS